MGFSMDFLVVLFINIEVFLVLVNVFGKVLKEVLFGFDYFVVFDFEEEIKLLKLDFEKFKEFGLWGVVVIVLG